MKHKAWFVHPGDGLGMYVYAPNSSSARVLAYGEIGDAGEYTLLRATRNPEMDAEITGSVCPECGAEMVSVPKHGHYCEMCYGVKNVRPTCEICGREKVEDEPCIFVCPSCE